MTTSLKKWEDIIKEKRRKTTFRDFVMEIGSWNIMVLYRNQGLLSRYPESDRIFNLTDPKKYEESRDTFLKYGIDYNFSKTFFGNSLDLRKNMPLLSANVYENSENANYAESVWMSKNVYLSFLVIENCENIFYTFYTQDNVKNVLNSVMVWDNSENVYFGVGILKGFNIFYSKFIVNSSNIWFSANLIGCSECIFCDGLENQSYCINNKQLDKEVYIEQKKKILEDKASFFGYYTKLNSNGMNLGSDNIMNGKFCVFSKNIKDGFFNYRLENGKNVVFVGDKEGRKNVMDTMCSDQIGSGDIYACMNLGTSINVYCCNCIIGQNLYYCNDCINCSFCIGCIGLKNKSYCIMNKEYSKEEWYQLADKIFSQMNNDGILGNFFPGESNPFYFNDTLAYLIDDTFTKEEVEKKGYMWRDSEIKVDISDTTEVIETKDLDIINYDESILNKVIKDNNGNYYKIVKMEYDFLKKHNLPLPEIHWLDRIKMGFKFN